MTSEEQLIHELKELRRQKDATDREGEALCLLADFLDQIGKHELAEALRFVDFPANEKTPVLRLVK